MPLPRAAFGVNGPLPLIIISRTTLLNVTKMAASIAHASRFALLKIEDDDSDEQEQTKKETLSKQTQQAKKKNKKKKKDMGQMENTDLKNVAHGKSVGAKNQGKSTSQPVSEAQWENWKKLDTEYTSEAYQKDLQQALLQSRVEFEEQKKILDALGATNGNAKSAADKKQKKKKEKPSTMSLDQFNEAGEPCQPLGLAMPEKVPAPPAQPDTSFFDRVEDDAANIIRKEQIQAEYTKQYIAENVRAQQYHSELSKKDKEIAMLRATVKNFEDELKQVKKRNKQLCVIMAQGEMKDKADVLMQVDQLQQVRDELTEEVGRLNSELEKERSQVHRLKTELEKHKGGKQGGK